MKTALIKTELWDDDTFYEMNIDTKLIYLLLLTSPERGVGRIFKMSDRLISARSGLNQQQITTCKKQLEQTGVVFFKDNYILLAKESSFIQPVKGRLTEKVLQKEVKDLPDLIVAHFSELTDIEDYISYRNGTGTVHELDNDKDKDKDNVIDNDYDSGYRKFKRIKQELLTR